MASRLSTNPQRSLSLPEQLEKLEQSITLTLQGALSSHLRYVTTFLPF